MPTPQDFRNNIKPNWCPGCGHYAVQNALQQAVAKAGISPERLALISGIGCSGRISGYNYSYGFHATHGRALPVAQGIKMGNRDLTVIACSGDGDAFAIGLGHTIHAIRRNLNLTYIVMDNHVYGLTKGQASPRSDVGFQTKTTPYGSVETPLRAIETVLAAGATFVGQSFSLNLPELVGLLEAAITHKGFSFINVFSPCVTFNHNNTYDWFKEHLTNLETIPSYNPQNRMEAMQTVMAYEGLVTGLIYQNKDRLSYQDAIQLGTVPLTGLVTKPAKKQFNKLMNEFS